MSWTLPKRNKFNKRVVLNYQDLTQNRAQTVIFKQLGGPVFVTTEGHQGKSFTNFIGEKKLTTNLAKQQKLQKYPNN